ncbi:MAG: mannose-1-phosphate guanylyltransferase [Lachnospiraceae bacterium]
MKVYGVIMAGGGGTRFWPLSRRELPKQFLNLTGKDILVNETFDRLKRSVPGEDIFVVTNVMHAEKTVAMMNGRIGKHHILAEPAARNTAACIGYAAMEILKKYGDGIMCVVPSDHYIQNEECYAKVISRAVRLAETQNCLVTIGIKPTFPSTGYGYIRKRKAETAEDGTEYSLVEEFVEKPEKEVAARYLADGHYVWNSGMFVWKASLILQYFERLLPDIYECLKEIGNAMGTEAEQEILDRVYPHIPKISIDYGIMERADKVIVLDGDFGWSDVGNLDALETLHEGDAKGNVEIGNCVLVDTEETICYSKDKLLVTAYVQDLIVVESTDAILVCPKSKAQEVRKIVEELQKRGRTDYL